MKRDELALVDGGWAGAGPARQAPDAAAELRGRVRLDGKYFACGGRRVRIQGVTYGPFAPNAAGEPLPEPRRVRVDFDRMRAIGLNAVRTYHVPPDWFLDLADEQGMGVLVDVPWPKHLCFLEGRQVREQARQAVRRAAARGRSHPCVLAYSIGNEIPPNVVRWHGSRRVERFLAGLRDVARQADPDSLVSYANYPPTEYLDLSGFDFATFNVYLHDRETFRRYLFRLQNLVGDRPLLLGELGMDTLRHGELGQADFLGGHLREATLLGLAGAFVFAWTDDWFTGGYPVHDWAFGITHADRAPKAAYHALREVFEASPAALLPAAPRVSVVVCSYNGGATLDQCLRSLIGLDYPDYEVIVVDDGSTDDTRRILARFPTVGAASRAAAAPGPARLAGPTVRVIHQPNRGLSAARNVGLAAATGSVVAYTDSDCFADPHWLTHLVSQLLHTGAGAVGGPNLTPEDGWLAACVAAAPGQPTHVLESDQVAEHIPGCNMAFRRETMEATNGFDPQYRKAGDDVDVCWRLQQAGSWITFAPGAFVWHHRRQTPRAYLRQQAGYGEAEALLQFKHPDRFNGRGDGKWRGVLYGASLQGLRLGGDLIYRGTFGAGLFQCLYQRGPAHWAMLPSTLEWHLGAALAALAAVFWWPAWGVVAGMLLLALLVAGLQAAQATLAPAHDGLRSRLVVAALCYAQPLVRSWKRYRTRLFSYCRPVPPAESPGFRGERLALTGMRQAVYWSEQGCERTELLGLFIAFLMEHRWGTAVDSGWSDWDVEVHYHPWTMLQVRSAQEDHGGGKRLIRVRYRLRPTPLAQLAGALGAAATVLAAGCHVLLAAGAAAVLAALAAGAWWRGARLAAQAAAGFDGLARGLGLIRCGADGRAEDPGRRPGGGGPG
jgi:GT2 family glycosyltransferase